MRTKKPGLARPGCGEGTDDTGPSRTAGSARQVAETHQELIDGPGGLTAFPDGPDDQRLAAAHVAGREHLGHAGGVAVAEFGARLRVAAAVLVDTERLQHGG